jgi:glucokinase
MLEKIQAAWHIRHEVNWLSRDFDSLQRALHAFLDELSLVERAGIREAWIAVAGPVSHGRVRFTNLAWECEERSLESALNLPSVHLVNDMEALAHAIPTTPAREWITLQTGQPDDGPRLLLAVGTGLGVVSWRASESGIQVQPSEGGHSDFASLTVEQQALWQSMAERYGHVSYERLLSGPGLEDIYAFQCRQLQCLPFDGDPDTNEPAPMICQRAESGEDEAAASTIRCFTEILGAFVGNAALYSLATGGIFLAGSLLTRLHPYLGRNGFLQAFQNKGRLGAALETMPIIVVTSKEPGLEGISHLAADNCSRQDGPSQQDASHNEGVHAGSFFHQP